MPQDWRQENWPEVSVSVVTYNQAHLIERTLDSILAQQVSFDYEIVVGDDCSTDGTRDILERYRTRHPDKIRLLLYDQRLPGTPGRQNNMRNPMACRGKYTALLDGDDYWIDPHKLQSQYEVMERHPELSISLHDTRCTMVGSDGKLIPDETYLRSDPPERKPAAGFYDHAFFCADRNIRVHTSSFFFRTRIFGDWPQGYEAVVAADHYFFLLISQRGPAYYDPTVRSVCEAQPASLTRSPAYLSEERVAQRIRDLRTYRRRFPATRRTVSYSVFAARHLKWLIFAALRRGKVGRACSWCVQLLAEPRGLYEMVRHRVSKSIKFHLPHR
ncbi:glycosyltransferase family 2 protein [Neolewinella sp.]|uniref:glycosyltransferase family 2 protein n=1 Tax=Neolewinella sp. TaxID=2993543 RepID=UPI003B52C5E5